MPQDFLQCIKDNGKVITKRVNKDEYMKFCKDSKGWHEGEVHKYKRLSKTKKS